MIAESNTIVYSPTAKDYDINAMQMLDSPIYLI
jgi:hypothetical protein